MSKRLLHIVESAYRATLEEQDDPVVWLCHAMRGAGAALDLLLQGNAVAYGVREQESGAAPARRPAPEARAGSGGRSGPACSGGGSRASTWRRTPPSGGSIRASCWRAWCRCRAPSWRCSSRATTRSTGGSAMWQTRRAPGICGDVSAAIGNTPLLRLRRASETTGCTILGKAEFMNPGGSVKDRAALSIVLDAERRGAAAQGRADRRGHGGQHRDRPRAGGARARLPHAHRDPRDAEPGEEGAAAPAAARR